MSGGNLQAVDRVVKIVRELDRHHGFAIVEKLIIFRCPAESRPDTDTPRPWGLTNYKEFLI
jgi:hypothetical protein